MKLLQVLKELGADGVGKILDNSGSVDSKTVVATLQKHMQRSKAIDMLEGHDRYSASRKKETEDDEGRSDDDPDATPGKL
jgi:cytokinesis protein